MRKYLRAIARSQMEAQGVKHINKKKIPVRNGQGKDTGARVSFFSLYWRDYVNPRSRMVVRNGRPKSRLRRLFSRSKV